MEFLRTLASIRSPFLNTVFSCFTMFGEETAFILIALILYWCISKKLGTRVLIAGFIGNLVNVILKISFRIPRPWILDESFTIVETARATATGYSFPSGHTQIAVTTAMVIALSTKKRWVRILCGIVMVGVPFSRMYLGVHTPLDTGVGFAVAAVTAVIFHLLLRDNEFDSRRSWIVIGCASLCALLFSLILPVLHLETVADAGNLADTCKNAAVMLGCCAAFSLGRVVDSRYIRFDEAAPLLVQIIKVGLGLAIVMGVRIAAKAVLGTSYTADCVRYFLMTFLAAGVWPLAFAPLSRLGKGRA